MTNVYYLLLDWCKRDNNRQFRIERDRVYVICGEDIVCVVAATNKTCFDHKTRIWLGPNASIVDCAESAIKRFDELYPKEQA